MNLQDYHSKFKSNYPYSICSSASKNHSQTDTDAKHEYRRIGSVEPNFLRWFRPTPIHTRGVDTKWTACTHHTAQHSTRKNEPGTLRYSTVQYGKRVRESDSERVMRVMREAAKNCGRKYSNEVVSRKVWKSEVIFFKSR
jgi:hypothetical protein